MVTNVFEHFVKKQRNHTLCHHKINSGYIISWRLVENWLRNQQRSFTMGYVKLTRDTHLGTQHLISGGGGGEIEKVCGHKSQKKKFAENVGRKKGCCWNWEKICWPEKTQNGNVHNSKNTLMYSILIIGKYFINSTEKTFKKIRTFIGKKNSFTRWGKKKRLQATKILPPPPQIYDGASLSYSKEVWL